MEQLKKNELIKGTVMEIGWDDERSLPRIALMTNEEAEYEVLLEGVGIELVDYVDEEVSVRGRLIKNEIDDFFIKVRRFRVLEPKVPSRGRPMKRIKPEKEPRDPKEEQWGEGQEPHARSDPKPQEWRRLLSDHVPERRELELS